MMRQQLREAVKRVLTGHSLKRVLTGHLVEETGWRIY